jgi:DNA-binding beta-propeller fold protein YncE
MEILGTRRKKMKKYYLVLLTILVMMSGTLIVAKPGTGRYHLLKKIPLGEAPGGVENFDYLVVDTPARRVYVTHASEVRVFDADTFAEVGKVSGMKKTHGVALVKELGKGYITDGEAYEVAVFDINTLKVTARIKGLVQADNIIYDPASKHVFCFNGDVNNNKDKSFNAIDPKTDTLIKSVQLPGPPEASVADGKGTVYDNNVGSSEIVVIDSKALNIKAKWPVAPGGEPTSLAMDRQNRRLFSAGHTPATLVVMDADNGKVLQSLPVSDGADSATFDSATGLVYVSTRAGKVHIFHEDSPDKLSEVETVSTEYGAKTMALDPQTHNIFLTTSDFGPPPAPTPEHPHPNPPQILGTARVLVYGD